MSGEFHMPDSWYEPEPLRTPSGHIEGCIKDHDPEDGDCWTREDYESTRADEEYDRMKDGYE